MDAIFALLARSSFALFNLVASPRLSILIFHRVHASADALFPREMDAARFDRLIRFVARSFRVMTLGDAVNCLARGSLPSRALVITFDDGYADNAEVALPILQRHGLPATFFVSTGFLDGGRMWNDSVIECLRVSSRPTIDLEFAGLGQRTVDSATERRQAITALLSHIKYLGLAEREDAIARLQVACDVEKLPTKLMMTSPQVREMHRAGMEIGAHTVNHPILTALNAAQAEDEISAGRDRLQSIIDAPVDLFAYPNGKPDRDYDDSHVQLLKKLGFRAAVSTAPGVSQTSDDLLQLPRFTPWGDSLATWATRL
ncbi:MAG: polysaccharide deacetylase family protein, partial [Propionivibrio sp.]